MALLRPGVARTEAGRGNWGNWDIRFSVKREIDFITWQGILLLCVYAVCVYVRACVCVCARARVRVRARALHAA